MPISFTELGALFNHLDEVFGNEGCDHTLKITTAFLKSRNLNAAKILPWLGEYGGFWDCGGFQGSCRLKFKIMPPCIPL